MGMFDNYNNQCIFDIPNNIHNEPVREYNIIEDTIPHKIYNINNKFIGYRWNYGDIFTFNINVNDIIKVHRDSIIFDKTGETPDSKTRGYKGQQAYNTFDKVSWTCVGCINGLYVWVEDAEITYDKDGTKEIELITDVTNKTVEVSIYNFRYELIKTFKNSNCNIVSIDINESIYEVLSNGLYKCVVRIIDDKINTVKDEFTINII